jgi:hypothetical protein
VAAVLRPALPFAQRSDRSQGLRWVCATGQVQAVALA